MTGGIQSLLSFGNSLDGLGRKSSPPVATKQSEKDFSSPSPFAEKNRDEGTLDLVFCCLYTIQDFHVFFVCFPCSIL